MKRQDSKHCVQYMNTIFALLDNEGEEVSCFLGVISKVLSGVAEK